MPFQRETEQMIFSVIFSVDAPACVDIDRYTPPQSELWEQTEGDEGYEYGYMEGSWTEGFHRKFCALLNRQQFDAFISKLGLYAEDVHTLGSIGAPGCGFGCSPAISFTADDPDALLSAYVTPLPEVEKESCDERDWDRVRAAVLSVYG